MASSGKQLPVSLANPNLQSDRRDILYHLGLDSGKHDLRAMFGDTKVVCMGGSAMRMKRLAEDLAAEQGIRFPAGQQGLENLIPDTDRYVMYKAGPIVCVNHGMGIPSISIVLHELAKLLNLAGCTGVTFFRLGTCGGLGLEPGTVCVSTQSLDTRFRPYLEQFILGQAVQREAVFDKELVNELLLLAAELGITAVSCCTLCTGDFYEEQGRTDGAICEHTQEQRLKFLRQAHERGVRNIEMESLAFAAITHKLGIKAACIAVTLLDRFKHDQVAEGHDVIASWERRMLRLLSAFIKRRGIFV